MRFPLACRIHANMMGVALSFLQVRHTNANASLDLPLQSVKTVNMIT